MKCDKLKAYTLFTTSSLSGQRVYLTNDADAAIAELKDKLHDAEMAKDDAECANTEYREDIKKLKDENERIRKIAMGNVEELRKAHEKELRATSRALWLARAYRAEAQWNRLLRDAGICFAVGRSKEWDILNQKQKKWQNVERLCRWKAEEYK